MLLEILETRFVITKSSLRAPRIHGVVEHLTELLVEDLFFTRALGLQIAHAIEFFFANFPSLLRDAYVGAEHDAAELVANHDEVSLGDVTDEVAGLTVEACKLDLVTGDLAGFGRRFFGGARRCARPPASRAR